MFKKYLNGPTVGRLASLALLLISAQGRLSAAVVDSFLEAEDLDMKGQSAEAGKAWRAGITGWLELSPQERIPLLGEVETALRSMDALSAENGDVAECIPLLERLAALQATGTSSADSALRSLGDYARYLLGWARLEAGKGPEAAHEAWKGLGLLERWKVIGPFDNERGSQLLSEGPPEKELKADAKYDGKKRPVAWRTLPARPLAGTLQLDQLFEPREQCLAYLLTFVESRTAQAAVLHFGSNEGYRIWVNGQLAATADLHRGFDLDQSAVGIQLQAGWSSILVKSSQTTDDWQWVARLTGIAGERLEGVVEGEPPSFEAAPRLLGEAHSASFLGGTLELTRSRAQDDGNNARLHRTVAALLLSKKAHDENEHPDTQAIERAIQIDGSRAGYHYLLAQTRERESTIAAQRDDNAWRQALEKAASLGSARAAHDLAHHFFETFGNLERAAAYVAQALKVNPQYTDAIELQGQIEEKLEIPGAEARALRRAWDLPHRPTALLLKKADALLDAGRLDEAEKLQAEAARRSSSLSHAELHEGLVRLAAARGNTEAAFRHLEAWSGIIPFGSRPHLLRAEILEGLSRFDEAVASVDAALRIKPEDHELHEKRGRILLLGGKQPEALAAFDQALALQPNLPDLREYVEYLRAAKDTFEESFRRDVAGIVKEALEKRTPGEGGEPARVLFDLTAIQVNEDGTTKTFAQEVIQVLNDRGVRMYDDFGTYYASGEQRLEFKKARVHRTDGSTADAKLSRYGYRSEGEESGGYSGGSVDLPPLAPGDVVEIEYVREDLAQSFFGDYFGHQEVFQAQVPIQEKTLVLRVPEDRKFYFHQRNLKLEPVVARDEASKTVTYTWTREKIPKMDPEPGMPSMLEVSPTLEVSTFENWDSFNTWYWNLIKKQFETSPEIQKKVTELTSGLDQEIDKIRAIYNFVVTDIRYNAWEFGVHGFKPYNAATIFARRFGDCKDKALLLSVMLREAGVTARPVLIKAENRRGKEDLTLPMVNHFNHCIAFVPEKNGREGLYLDGTAQFHAYRDVPSMDRGATVLVVSDSQASVQQVPWNKPEELGINEEATVRIDPDLGATMMVRAQTSGDYSVHLRSGFEIAQERRTQLERIYGKRFAASVIEEDSFSNLLDLDVPVSFTVKLKIPRFVMEAPEGLTIRAPEDFFSSSQSLSGLASLEKREQDILLGNPRSSRLKTIYLLPEGYRVKSLPQPIEIEGRFGRLRSAFSQEGPGKVVAERSIEITSHRVSTAEYAEFREFAASVGRLEDAKILLEKA